MPFNLNNVTFFNLYTFFNFNTFFKLNTFFNLNTFSNLTRFDHFKYLWFGKALHSNDSALIHTLIQAPDLNDLRQQNMKLLKV